MTRSARRRSQPPRRPPLRPDRRDPGGRDGPPDHIVPHHGQYNIAQRSYGVEPPSTRTRRRTCQGGPSGTTARSVPPGDIAGPGESEPPELGKGTEAAERRDRRPGTSRAFSRRGGQQRPRTPSTRAAPGGARATKRSRRPERQDGDGRAGPKSEPVRPCGQRSASRIAVSRTSRGGGARTTGEASNRQEPAAEVLRLRHGRTRAPPQGPYNTDGEAGFPVLLPPADAPAAKPKEES